MKKLFLFFLVSFSIATAQTEVKQITDFDFDATHPAFPINAMDEYMYAPNNLFFEIHNDDSSNIAALSYDFENDNFENLFYLTRDGFINKNPNVFLYYFDSFIAMWETNRNGNFDIAYSKYEEGNWLPVQIATETEEDETEISFVRNQDVYNCECAQIVFTRNGSIIIADILEEQLSEDTVFTASGAITFSQPAAGYKHVYEPDLRLIAAAISDSAGVSRRLVYREKDNSGLWSEIKTVNLSGMQSNPSFDFEGKIIFDNYSGEKSSVYYFNTDSGSGVPEVLLSDSLDSYYNFKSVYLLIVTKDLTDFISWFPFAAEKKSGDNNYAFASSYYDCDTSVAVSVLEPQPDVGTVNISNGYYVSYSVWVDSANGHTNLFGIKRLDQIGEVADNENSINGYKLYQNYPNPFNPTTIIKYSIPLTKTQNLASQLIKLKIFDILGREVATLVNQYQRPGNYSVKFDASNLPSGIYLYALKAGNFFAAKKMTLMK